MTNDAEIVLITGGSGFLGQHIVKHLQENDKNVKEIRIVDLKPYRNKLDHAETKPIVSYIGDICEPETIVKAFENVDVVYHCAALITFQYPPNLPELERVNINGTKNIINLCIKTNVSRLIYTSSASIVLVSYLGKAPFAVVVNQTESRIPPPASDSNLIIPGYSASKLRAERILLGAHGTNLSNGVGELLTTAIRPTIMYGEEDNKFFPTIAKLTKPFGGIIPKLFGNGGKHQLSYVGNVAWAHILAKDSLKKSPKNIGGLPVFITDDTPIEDTCRFCQRLSRGAKAFNLRPTSLSIPIIIGYLFAILLELLVSILNPLFGVKVPFQPRALVAYSGSLIQYSRLRADIHMDYAPLYNEEQSFANSRKWYEKWYESYFSRTDKKEKAA